MPGELMRGPAYCIQTSRLILRCWNPEDAPLLVAAITESLDHLRPWMLWAQHEPEDLEAKVQRLRQSRGNFDLGRDFTYGIFNPEETRVLGGTGLHTRLGEGVREIGYWIHKNFTGQGLATEAAAALTRVAFEIDAVKRVEIHCDPANGASAAVARKLGYTHEATLRQRTVAADGRPRDMMTWTLLQDEYPRSQAAAVWLEAFDALGRKLL